MKSPVFLFSLPRSGSTLLQRILMSHKDIASVAEPWFLLPLVYAVKPEGTLSYFSSSASISAFDDFLDNSPNKKADYYEALASLARTLYEKQCYNDEPFFLDKTPRYYNIIPEIAQMFPDAKFIFLFRNPAHVMSSMIQTWSDGNLSKLYEFERDLKYGPIALSEGYSLLKDKAYAIQYEKLVNDPDKYIKEISAYLEIDFDSRVLINFSEQKTQGRMGDPTGVKESQSINMGSLDKWKATFNTQYRVNVVKRYINDIDDVAFDVQGYNKDLIIEELSQLDVRNNGFIRDRVDFLSSHIKKIVKPNIWFGKYTKTWAGKEFLS